MDVLCTDKTGTLTEGVISLEGGFDALGATAQSVIEFGAINAALETALASPLDDAILDACRPDGNLTCHSADPRRRSVISQLALLREGLPPESD